MARWLLLLLVCACGGPQAARAPAVAALTELPVVPLAGGDPVRLAELARGRVTVIDFFATWCQGCRENFSHLRKLAEKHPDDGGRLFLVAVDVGEKAAAVVRFLEAFPAGGSIFLDPDYRFEDSLGTTLLPLVLIVDRDGKIVHRATKLDQETLELVEKLLP
jgi:thiol-disulfide isomerase/thioredoxin